MPDTSPTPDGRPAESILGPITPICCPEPDCHWAVHGVPDKYADSRARIVREHVAAEHTPTPEPRPAALLRAAAVRARETGGPLHTVLALLLDAVAVDAIGCRCVPECPTGAALAVARQLLGTTGETTAVEEQEPIQLRWGLNDVMYGDDDTTTILLSGPGREPYWVELDPERTAALRDALAGLDASAPPAPADRAAKRNEIRDSYAETIAMAREDRDHEGAFTLECQLRDREEQWRREDDAAAGVQPPTEGEEQAASPRRRLAGEAAAGAHQTKQAQPADEDQPVVAYRDPRHPRVLFCLDHGARWHGVVPVTAEDLPDGGICTFGQLSSYACGRDVLATPVVPAAPEETQ
ncbi:hypothetical protein [Streptomyces californicus]|uniref:hypothetical protein n=1 Tax=Streptomyces californicus TaxID=67351 RepID=UPI00368D9716